MLERFDKVKLKIGQIITINNQDKYRIVSKAIDNDNTYLYLSNSSMNKVVSVQLKENRLSIIDVVDDETLRRVVPILNNNLQQFIIEL